MLLRNQVHYSECWGTPSKRLSNGFALGPLKSLTQNFSLFWNGSKFWNFGLGDGEIWKRQYHIYLQRASRCLAPHRVASQVAPYTGTSSLPCFPTACFQPCPEKIKRLEGIPCSKPLRICRCPDEEMKDQMTFIIQSWHLALERWACHGTDLSFLNFLSSETLNCCQHWIVVTIYSISKISCNENVRNWYYIVFSTLKNLAKIGKEFGTSFVV